MKLIAIILTLIVAACASMPKKVTEGVEIRTLPLTLNEKLKGKTEGQTVFATAYADIPKGASMPMVMGLLGNPTSIVSEGQSEVWTYRLRYDKQLLVYFLNAGVTEVKER